MAVRSWACRRWIDRRHGAPQVRCARYLLPEAAEGPGRGEFCEFVSGVAAAGLRGALSRLNPRICALQDAYAASATQLQSVAPTQLDGVGLPPPLPPPGCAQRPCSNQQLVWGLQQEASYFASLDSEQLLETTSRQTTPAASRAASPGGPAAASQQPWGPSTAPQHADADLAAVITQQLAATQHTPCSEEIRRHWPHVQVGWSGVWDVT